MNTNNMRNRRATAVETSPTLRSGVVGIWLGLGVGLLAGGAAALFLTPGSGKQNRDMVKNRALQAKEAIVWHAEDEAMKVEPKPKK
jgi:gas vesicle protein